jgi:hypothetical protein
MGPSGTRRAWVRGARRHGGGRHFRLAAMGDSRGQRTSAQAGPRGCGEELGGSGRPTGIALSQAGQGRGWQPRWGPLSARLVGLRVGLPLPFQGCSSVRSRKGARLTARPRRPGMGGWLWLSCSESPWPAWLLHEQGKGEVHAAGRGLAPGTSEEGILFLLIELFLCFGFSLGTSAHCLQDL